MKKLVFQLAVEPEVSLENNSKITTFSYDKDMYNTSERMARLYAKKCGADYYVVKNKNDWAPGIDRHVAFQKFKIYDFDDYDRILYIDSDYIIKENAPNIFDMYNSFAAAPDPGGSVPQLASKLGIPADRYFNSGFLYFTKEVLIKTKEKILECDLTKKWKLRDQAVWNKIMYECDINFVRLDPSVWNPVTQTFGEYGDHYSGIHKNKWGRVTY